MTSTAAEWRRPTPRRVRAVRDRLRLVYGIPQAKPHGHPIAELILTVLSQSTNDRNRDVAYLALRERFPTWDEVRDAPVDEIEEAIRPGGISKVKSARIKSILRAITATSPRSELSLWTGWPSRPVPEAQEYLTGLPGVGRKTAACVLLFASGCTTCPSTPMSRGWACGWACSAPARGFVELHDTMLAITPPGRGARVPPEPAPPRPAHLPRAPPGLPRLRAAAHVPERLHVRLKIRASDEQAESGAMTLAR